MPTPNELVTDAFAQAKAYADSARAQLAVFTDKLSAAMQTAPLVSLSFNPVPTPSTTTVRPFQRPSDYTDNVLTTLTALIISQLGGGTGLTPAVETAIWDRARERELALSQARIDQASRDVEALGFELPPGVLNDAIRRETRDYYDKVSTLSRDVAVKQAELEQGNMQKAIDQATQFETTLADILAKRTQVEVQAYQADVERFKAEVEQEVKYWEALEKQLEAQINYVLSTEKMNTEVVRANLATILEAAKTGAQVYAQLTASAYSLIHASASVSAGAGTTVSYQYANETETKAPTVTAV